MSIIVDFPAGNVYNYIRLRNMRNVQEYTCERTEFRQKRHKFCWIYIIETKEKHKT